ncbi:MAG: CHAT domain-containing protein [Chitinophagaceae bacterium]|nr:MAG: CHAT domain-containing protein [Chitinophagaceae bacterium]
MIRNLLCIFLLCSLNASSQIQWDSTRTTIDTIASAGGSFSVSSGWTFATAEEYDESDFIQAKVDQFYVSVERRPDSLASVRWRLVQQRLRADEVFLDFLFTEFNDQPCYITSVIRSTGIPQVVVVPALKDAARTTAASAAVRGIETANAQVAGSYMSYKNLLAHIEPKLSGARTIYYSTSNDLNLVNLKFLKGNDGKCLFEKFDLVRLHSGASFLGNGQRLTFPKRMKVLLVGNVDYNCGEDGEPFWDALPGSKVEIRNIAGMLRSSHQVDVLDSCRATEARFVEAVNKTRYDIVHLATHGFYFPPGGSQRFGLAAGSYPLLFTGIVLSGANNKAATVDFNDEHGMFTTMDFKKLDVRNLRLVVLSTCYSGTGETEHSSAPFGLTLALLRQGVQAMVLSNRAIPDQETTEFMTVFYKNLGKLLDADAAFNRTLRDLKTAKPNVDWSFMDLVH